MRYRLILACCLLVGSIPAGWTAPAPAKTTVSLDLKETPLRQAINTLFESSGLQHAIYPDVPDQPITLTVHDMPFEEALRTLLRIGTTSTFIQGAGVVRRELSYRKEGDVYLIGLRRDDPAPQPVGEPGQGSAAEVQSSKITLNYLRPGEAAEYLGKLQPLPGIVSIQPLERGNALIVRGEPSALTELNRLIELADMPPKPLTITVGVTGPGLNGVPLAIRSSAHTLVGDDLTIDEQSVLNGQPAHLKVTVTTQLLGDGPLQVASDWDLSVPVAGGPKGPIRLVKRLNTRTQLRPGEQTSVGEVDLSGWGGKGTLRLWIRGDWRQPGAAPGRTGS
jgi:type II/III secretion system protein